MEPELQVLVVDDEPFVRRSLCELLAAEGIAALPASSAVGAVATLARTAVDVVVSDLRMPAGDVFELLEHPATHGTPVIVITGAGTVAEAVRAMKAGAFDFIQKPVDPEELLLLIERANEHRRLRSEVHSLRDTVRRLRAPHVLVGASQALARVRERIAQVAPTEASVMITGESGTGKELAAEQIHAESARSRHPLWRVHCAAVTSESFLAALEGVDGAAPKSTPWTTLLLDEITLLPLESQASLLRVLDANAPRTNGPDGLRVIATSNTDINEALRSGALRTDLYWRLNVFPIEMPPLREHREDIPELVEHFLEWSRNANPVRGDGESRPGPTAEALSLMAAYGWPGNVRELRNMIERSLILAGGRPIDVATLRDILEPALSRPIDASGSDKLHLRLNLDATEKELVLRALERAEGVKKMAAHLLGIDARNLGYYLRKHGLQ
ncbi:MAG: sigma-54-dependent Fis family transcriptional regulator [Planctomycetes bacterium]|nr:sigma-54-dependent Fis family transcriptional regulator [Planctomycetota bacterium]